MGVVIINQNVTKEDLDVAKEEYGDFIKLAVDIENRWMAIGGEWHSDCEKVLINNGSNQNNVWGGGIDISSGKIDTISLINIRPNQNNDSQEIVDPTIRNKVISIVKEKFDL